MSFALYIPPFFSRLDCVLTSHGVAFCYLRKVLILGVVVGSLNACVAGLVPLRIPHLFTNSMAVTAGMRSLVPLLSWSLLTHACVMGLEGILLARRRLRFLAGYDLLRQGGGGACQGGKDIELTVSCNIFNRCVRISALVMSYTTVTVQHGLQRKVST